MAYDAGQLNQIFSQSLGRAPSQSEIEFLKPYLDQGYISHDQIGKYLQGSTEAMQPRLAQQTQQYGNLLGQNNQFLLNQAADTANQQFAANGRQWSSGQGNSILQAGQQLAAQQSPMIANYYGQGQQGLNNMYAMNGQNALQRAYNLEDTTNQRRWEMGMYQTQKSDYNNYLNQANKSARASGIGSLIGGAVGGVGGFMAGGPMGGMMGASAGSRAGGGVGSLFG